MNTENNTNAVVQEILEKRKPEIIDVDELVTKYKAKPTDIERKKYLKSIIKINRYVGHVMKYSIAKRIVQYAYTEQLKDEKSSINVDNVMLNYLTDMAIIQSYTNINLMDSSENYDKLCESGIYKILNDELLSDDIQCFRDIVKQVSKDFIQNHYNVEQYIKMYSNALNNILENVTKSTKVKR